MRDSRARAGYVLNRGGKVAGSCTLVAPGILATCAHVVADALGIDRRTRDAPSQAVETMLQAMGQETGTARVEHWSPFDPALSSGSDLALLRLDRPTPTVVSAAPVGRTGTILAGRSVETICLDSPLPEGELRQGEIVDASASFLTIHGQGYGAPGMSGAGVWAVDGDGVLLGLFSGVPDGRTQTEAYAIPSSAIVDALAGLGIHAGRGGGLFEPYPRPLHAAFGPATLLDARYGIAPFVADPAVEACLDAWIDRDDPLLVRLEYGPGGVGKTRRWLEYCCVREGRGLYGLLSRRDDPAATADHYAKVAAGAAMRVVVVDYAESQPILVTALLTHAVEARQGRTRIILIARNAAEWWARLRRSDGALQALLTSRAVTESRAEPMGIPEARQSEAMAGAVRAYAGRLGIRDEVAVSAFASYGSALEMQMVALSAVMGGEGGDQVAAVLDRERRFWQKSAPSSTTVALLEAMAAAIYRVDGIATRSDAEAMFYRKGAFRDLALQDLTELFDLMRRFYPGEQFLNPMQPDLIGERLLEERLLEGFG